MIDLIFSFIHCLTTSSIGDDLPPLHVDGALIYEGGRLLQDGGAKSPTCNAIGLKDTCCLTLTFLTMPYMLTMFLIIKCKPCFSLISVTMLLLASILLFYLALIDFLQCVVALCILAVLQTLGTFVYILRRRCLYGSGFLDEQQDDRESPVARLLGGVLTQARREGGDGPLDISAGIRGGFNRDPEAANSGVIYGEARSRGTSSPSPNARRSGGGRRESFEGGRSSAMSRLGPSRSMGEIFDDISMDVGDALAARRASKSGPDPNDKNDPHNWSLDQLKAYLISTLPPGGKTGKDTDAIKIIENGAREYLVKRTCDVMGRKYREPTDDDNSMPSSREGNGVEVELNGMDEEIRPGVYVEDSDGRMLAGGGGKRAAIDSPESPLQREPTREGSRGKRGNGENPSSYDESFARKMFRGRRLKKLFPHLYDEDAINDNDTATSTSEWTASSPGSVFEAAKSKPGRERGYSSPDLRRSSSPPNPRQPKGDRAGPEVWASPEAVKPPQRRSSSSSGSRASFSSTASPAGSAASSSQQQQQQADGWGADQRAAANANDDDDDVAPKASPRQTTRSPRHSRARSNTFNGSTAQQRSQQQQQPSPPRRSRSDADDRARRMRRQEEEDEKVRQRRERRSKRAAEKAAALAAEANSMDDVRNAASKRVEAWSSEKDFFKMLSTLDAFEGLSLSKGIGTSRTLAPGAPVAAIKKAFHRASLSLHPDRLVGLADDRRAEAEEIFKVLSAAYEQATEKAKAELEA